MEGLKRFLLAGMAILLTAFAGLAQQDTYVWDFGKAQAGQKLEHVFDILNDTGVSMQIREVTVSCGCTASEVSKKDLAPGESSQVKVILDTAGYKGFIEQFVYVNTDSALKPVVKLTVKVEILP